MSVARFRTTLADASPPIDADLALQAVWWAGRGDWDQAHRCAQQHEGDPDCDWFHAHLHRQEGDGPNARYWYARARRPVATAPLADEWAAIAAALLAR